MRKKLMMKQYARFETHSHTDYSNLRLIDCINKPEKLIDRAVENGLCGIAITDHETVAGAVKTFKYKLKIQETHPDFKVALGNEIYLTDERKPGIKYYHFILIAKDKIGFRILRELSSIAWMNSYTDRGLERVPTLKSDLVKIIKKHGKGHLIATSACLGGELSTLTKQLVLAEQNGEETLSIKQGIANFMKFCIECFGDDYYVECAPGRSEDQLMVNHRLKNIAKAFNCKMVIGTDAHYLTKKDRFVHKAYLNSKEGDREVDSFYSFSYLQTEEEIQNNLEPDMDYEEMVKNSYEIYQKIEDYDILHNQKIPMVAVKNYPREDRKDMDEYPTLKKLFNSDDEQDRYWINECYKALIKKDLLNKRYLKRLEEEADIKQTIGDILGTNMFSYPITLQHYIDMMWECGSTIGAGRGSACAGLNHYLLGVTQLDPLKYDLPFWRYLNKARIELPDIDLDLCPSKRPIIIEKIKEERGRNFNKDVDELSRANLGATLVATFGTEKTKSAIQTACRGYRSEEYPEGIDVDTSLYLSSLIPQERGFLWDLDEVVYGNPEKGREPVKTFINEINQYPGLLDIAFGIQGIIKQRGSHASGIIFFDEDPYEFGAFMKAPNGDITTQFDLHDDEAMGLTKFDFLVTDVQDKIVETLKLLQNDNVIEKDFTIRQLYNKYLHPDVLPLEDKRIWDALENGSVINIFQFDSQVGSQAAKKIKPHNIIEMSDANGLMRLMTSEKGQEMPMEKYVRYKNNIKLWYEEMRNEGLTEEEIKIVEPHFINSYGVPPSQEQLMTMLMDENICAFDLKDANAARKIVGKKQMSKIPELREQILKQAKSPQLGHYIWKYGIEPQMGYSFSKIHSIAYSFIGVQTLFLGACFNPIYWNTGCLIINSGSGDLGGSTDYSKLAKAIGEIKEANINVSLVDINKSTFGFKPDTEHNQILFGLKGLLNMGDDVIDRIIENRPYTSVEDFLTRVPITKTAMIALIKAGAFDQFEDRVECMKKYLTLTSESKKKLTLQNMPTLMKYDLLNDKELNESKAVYEFNRYLKARCKKNSETYLLDDRAMNFIIKIGAEDLVDYDRTLDKKIWEKRVYQKYMDNIRTYISNPQILNNLNNLLFKLEWDKYASGSVSTWEMEVLGFYSHPHELINVNNSKYDLINFKNLPTEPVIEKTFKAKSGRDVNMFKINRICGTCIAKDNVKGNVTLLTTDGVVTVKFRKEYYALFNKQISGYDGEGKKHVLEKSWFNRGSLIIVQGFRSGDSFIPKKYASTGGHQLYKITNILPNGDLELTSTRQKGEMDEEI